ncbi:MAG TPA: hypothetical protein PL012_18160 [Candidatus Obscuribacter sp.]|nr:hypothetical protein [Candidatus Obscuribacter sp.]
MNDLPDQIAFIIAWLSGLFVVLVIVWCNGFDILSIFVALEKGRNAGTGAKIKYIGRQPRGLAGFGG